MRCPATSTLEDLLRGEQLGDGFSALCSHLSECSQCQAELDRLSGDSELKQWRTHAATTVNSIGKNTVFREALERATQFDTDIDSQTMNPAQQTTPLGPQTTLLFKPSEFIGDLGKLASYRVVREIGRGGMAIVFEAIDIQLDRRVALKVLRPEQLESQSQERFLREAKSIALVRHTNVVAIHSISSTADNIPFIAMEFADGGCLQKRVQRVGGIPPRQAAEWIAQVADGLAAAHQMGLIHRDIKPSNILLLSTENRHSGDDAGTREVAKLADFGLVRLVCGTNRETQTGMLLGTPSYMSPEHVTNFESVDIRSDIYSLGATLYETLTGEPPFRGALAAVLKQIEHDEPSAPRILNSDVPADLETICLKAMQRDRTKRYATAKDFSTDLRRWLAGEPILARPVTALEKLLRLCRRNPEIASLTGAVASLLLLLAIGSTYAAISIRGAENKLRTEKENVEDGNRIIQAAAADLELQRQIALESLNGLVTKVQTELASRPGTLKLRESILQTALEGLDRVTKNAGTLSSAHTTIEAHIRKGEILDLLGKTSDAIIEFETAATLAQTASDDSSEAIGSKRDLGNALFMQAEVHRKVFAYDLAQPIYERVLVIRNAVANKLPDDSDAQIALLSTLQRIADISFYRKDWDATQVGYDRVLEATQSAVTRFPENLLLKRSLVLAHERLGTLATSISQLDKAQVNFDKVLELNQSLLAADPQNRQFQADLAYITKRLASLASIRGDREAATRLAHDAIDRYVEIADSDPLDADAQMKVGSGWDTLYEVELASGNLSEASKAIQNSLQIFDSLAAKFTTAAKYPSLAMEALLKLASVQFQLGQFPECIQSMNGYHECFEQYSKAVDANPQNYSASLNWVNNAKVALRLAIGGLDSINQQDGVSEDVIYLAKTYVMYNFARSGDIENAVKIGVLIKDYRANVSSIATSGGLAMARAYAICLSKLEPHLVDKTNNEMFQTREDILKNCLAITRSLVEGDPMLLEFLRTDFDFKTIRQHSDFTAFSKNH